jgi:two-component system sensor histidine kinase YesM
MTKLKQLIKHISSLSIIKKLILGFLIILIPLYTFNFYVINIGSNKNRKEIHNSLASSIHSYISLLNAEFQRIETKMEDIAVEIALVHTRLSQLPKDNSGIPIPSPERTAIIKDIMAQVTDLQTSSRFIKNIQVFLPMLNETVTDTSTISRILSRDKIQQLAQLEKAQNHRLFYYQDGKLILIQPYIYESENYMDENGLFLMTAEVNDATIRILLNDITGYKTAEAALFPVDQTWNITTKKGSKVLNDILDNYPKGNPSDETGITDIITPAIDYMKSGGKNYIVAREYSSYLDAVLLVYAQTDDVFVSLKTYNSFFLIMSILSVVVIVAFSFWMYKIIHKPLTALVDAFRRVKHGELNFTVEYGNEDEFGYLYDKFNDMLSRLNSLIHEVYEQKIRNQQSELKRLQSQINPHFLYNSFFVLSRLIYSQDTEKASRFSAFLSRYFQFITRDNADEITLEKEVEHARTYTDIQTICYSGRILVNFGEIPEGFKDMMVPRLILQPVIENSYKHAFENKVSGAQLHVNFEGERGQGDKESLFIVVEDNGEEIGDEKINQLQQMMEASDSKVNETTGLYNVHRRISLKYGSNSGISVDRSPLGGLRIKIMIHFKDKH